MLRPVHKWMEGCIKTLQVASTCVSWLSVLLDQEMPYSHCTGGSSSLWGRAGTQVSEDPSDFRGTPKLSELKLTPF